MDWLTEIFEDVEMPCPAQGNIFLFKGRDKNGVPATRSEEITAWVRSIIHREAEHTTICESFDYINHVKNANDIGDAGGITLSREEYAMFREMVESQQAAKKRPSREVTTTLRWSR